MKKNVEPLVPGEYYHVYNRACGFDKLFIEDRNYNFFLSSLTDRLSEYIDLYCYCLLPNHFHLLLKTKKTIAALDPAPIISKEFSNFFCSYAMSFNRYYSRKGSLFSQNFRRSRIESMQYLRTTVVYIHRNPVKHGLVSDLKMWLYSSYKMILDESSNRSTSKEVIDWFGNHEIYKFCHLIEPETDIE